MRGAITGGDFNFVDSKFWANNAGQRRLFDLGDVATIPLYLADIPTIGYYKFGVPAEIGHTYVSYAQEGEEDFYIVFRVVRINGENVTIDYVYKSRATAVCQRPGYHLALFYSLAESSESL